MTNQKPAHFLDLTTWFLDMHYVNDVNFDYFFG